MNKWTHFLKPWYGSFGLKIKSPLPVGHSTGMDFHLTWPRWGNNCQNASDRFGMNHSSWFPSSNCMMRTVTLTQLTEFSTRFFPVCQPLCCAAYIIILDNWSFASASIIKKEVVLLIEVFFFYSSVKRKKIVLAGWKRMFDDLSLSVHVGNGLLHFAQTPFSCESFICH